MLTIQNEKVDIYVDGKKIRGAVTGSLDSWSCIGNSESFRELFPTGITYSYSSYCPVRCKRQLVFQDAVRDRIVEILLSRHVGK